MKNRLAKCISYVIVVCVVIVSSVVNADQTTDYSFLLEGAAARAMSMGGAFTALADDSSAVFWNPAGLAQIENREFGSMISTEYSYQDVIYVHPIEDIGTFGISAYLYHHTDLPAGYSDISDISFMGSYGMKLGKSLRFGISAKYLGKSLHGAPNTGYYSTYGVDVGVLWNISKVFAFGGVVQNLSPGLFMTAAEKVTESWRDPGLNYRFGVALKRFVTGVTLALDVNLPQDKANFVAFGIEYGMSRQSSLRVGYTTRAGINQGLHFGLSIGGKKLCFDWDIVPRAIGEAQSGTESERISRYGITWRFGDPITKLPEEGFRERIKELKKRGEKGTFIAVLNPIRDNEVPREKANAAGRLLRRKLGDAEGLYVMDKDLMGRNLAEKELDKNCQEEACVVKIGKALKVDKVMYGQLTMKDDGFILEVTVVDVKKEITLYIDKEEGSLEAGIEALVDKLAERLIKGFLN